MYSPRLLTGRFVGFVHTASEEVLGAGILLALRLSGQRRRLFARRAMPNEIFWKFTLSPCCADNLQVLGLSRRKPFSSRSAAHAEPWEWATVPRSPFFTKLPSPWWESNALIHSS